MNWKDVGNWVVANAGTGAALVGSLLTGNIPGAVAAGVAMVSSATGTNNPSDALLQLQTDPATLVRLKELAFENEKSIRSHLEAMTALELADKQAEHSETQNTIRAGDKAEDRFVRWTRPGQSWLSLAAALVYGLNSTTPSPEILLILLALPLAYAGLRQVGKGFDSVSAMKGIAQ